MPTAWRITKSKHATSAFDGEGARLNGGRWNSPGSPVVYTSSTASLAAMEILVHVERAALLNSYTLFTVEFETDLVTRIDPAALPSNWRDSPVPPDTQAIGDEWIRSGRSAVLEVPSAVMELETTYLLNPVHSDFRSIVITGPIAYRFDPRLARP